MDPVTGVSDRSPVVGGEAGLAGGTEEEEAMYKVNNKKKKKKERGGRERGNRWGWKSKDLLFFLSFWQKKEFIAAEINAWGLVVVALIMRALNTRRYYEGEGLVWWLSVLVTNILVCHYSHERRNPRTKEKEREKKYYDMHACIYFSEQYTHPNHTSREVWAQGAKCRGPFFLQH